MVGGAVPMRHATGGTLHAHHALGGVGGEVPRGDEAACALTARVRLRGEGLSVESRKAWKEGGSKEGGSKGG